MDKKKVIIITIASVVVLTAAYFGYKHFSSSDKDKKKKLDEIIAAFNKGGKDVFQGQSQDRYNKILSNFNLSDSDSDFLINTLALKKESQLSKDETARMKQVLGKLLGITIK